MPNLLVFRLNKPKILHIYEYIYCAELGGFLPSPCLAERETSLSHILNFKIQALSQIQLCLNLGRGNAAHEVAARVRAKKYSQNHCHL